MRRSVWCAAVACVLLAAPAHGQAAPSVDAAIAAAHEADAPLRNLVHLWLRIAGVVWIAVEWIAAVYLIRGFHALQRAIAQRSESGP